MRIQEHPIITGFPKGPQVTFYFEGQPLQGYEGEPIAAALKANNVQVHRYTEKLHKPRGIFCAIGRCTDCVMVVDGQANVRTCMTALKDGMQVERQHGVGPERGGKSK